MKLPIYFWKMCSFCIIFLLKGRLFNNNFHTLSMLCSRGLCGFYISCIQIHSVTVPGNQDNHGPVFLFISFCELKWWSYFKEWNNVNVIMLYIIHCYTYLLQSKIKHLPVSYFFCHYPCNQYNYLPVNSGDTSSRGDLPTYQILKAWIKRKKIDQTWICHTKNKKLTLRSKFKVKGRQLWYATHTLVVISMPNIMCLQEKKKHYSVRSVRNRRADREIHIGSSLLFCGGDLIIIVSLPDFWL